MSSVSLTYRKRQKLKGALLAAAVLLSTSLCATSAFAAKKPSVQGIRVKYKVSYEFVPENQTNCDKSGSIHRVGAEKAAGCTSPRNFVKKIDVQCDKKKITFSFGYEKYLVEIVNKYKKGTINFDQILKHELTHVSLYDKTAENFYSPVARALLMQYERSEKKRKSCFEIQSDVRRLFYKYMDKYHGEVEKQHDLIDGKENYRYQDEQAYIAMLFQTPQVKLSEKKTEYIPSSHFNSRIEYIRSFNIVEEVPVFSLKLMPVVYYSSDYPKDACRYKAGMKYAESRLERQRKVFRQISEELKRFLPEAFKKASQTKSKLSDIRYEGLEAADRMVLDRLEKADSEDTERESFFAACDFENQKLREAEQRQREAEWQEYEKQRKKQEEDFEKKRLKQRKEMEEERRAWEQKRDEMLLEQERRRTAELEAEREEDRREMEERLERERLKYEKQLEEEQQAWERQKQEKRIRFPQYEQNELKEQTEKRWNFRSNSNETSAVLFDSSDWTVEKLNQIASGEGEGELSFTEDGGRKADDPELPSVPEVGEPAKTEENAPSVRLQGIGYYLNLMENIFRSAVDEFELNKKFENLMARIFGGEKRKEKKQPADSNNEQGTK